MTEYKKPAQVRQHQSGRDMETSAANVTSVSNFSTSAGHGQEKNRENRKIFNQLPAGACNAVSRQQLMALTGLSERELRREISVERRSGALICTNTSSGGYYRPADVAELQRFVQSMTSRGRATFAAVSAARRLLREMAVENE